MRRHGLYSGHYSEVFVAPKNAQNAETKHQSEAVPILLLTLLALTTSVYSSLGVLQGLNPQRQLLKASVYHLATSAVWCWVYRWTKEGVVSSQQHSRIQSHMSGLAKNTLVLVLEYGCLHIFLTLTCNPDWPEIRSQLINCQTAFIAGMWQFQFLNQGWIKFRQISRMEKNSNSKEISVYFTS